MKHLFNCLQKIKNIPFPVFLLCSGLILIITALLSLCMGAAAFSFSELLSIPDIVRYVRIPRIIAAVFAGAGLAGAGVIIQSLFANPLAGPNIIGVNSGAGFMTLVAGLLFPLSPQFQPLAAFLGALLSVLLVYALSQKTGVSKMTLLLAGIILNSVFSAASESICVFFPDASTNYMGFRVGGFSFLQTSVLYPAVLIIIITCILALWKANTLELLLLGDDIAASLGVRVSIWRLFFLVCAALLAGAAVSFAGLIGFLGLIIPHGMRIFVGDDIPKLFSLSVLWGAILLLLCDTFSRTVFAPFELPVGIALSFIGAPVFIYILLNRKVRY